MIRFRNFCLFTLILLISIFPAVSRSYAQEPVVRAVFFYSPTCGHCKIVIEEVLPELDARYGTQLNIYGFNTFTEIGNYMYEIFVVSYNIPPEKQVVPILLVGDQFLVGSQQIPDELPGIIDEGLINGGIGWPELEGLTEAMAGTLVVDPQESTTIEEKTSLWDKFAGDLVGNSLAVVVLLGMILSLVFTGINLVKDKEDLKKDYPSWLIPVLSLVGIGVAGYLTYVEFNQMEAFCGPVGNCNAVQQSSYATLFGILPVGVLGLLGYLVIILLWLLGQLNLEGAGRSIDLMLWGVILMGLLYSIYLTFLEPFVIGATCLWCLSSAIIMSVLFLITSRKITS